MHMLDGAGPFKRPLLKLRGLLFEFFGKPECRTTTRALQIAVTKMPWHAIKTMSYAGAVRDGRRWIDPGNFIYSVFWMLAGYAAANLRDTSTAAEVRHAAAEFREMQKRARERWPRAGNSPELAELSGDLVELVLSIGYLCDRLIDLNKELSKLVLKVKEIMHFLEYHAAFHRGRSLSGSPFTGPRAQYLQVVACTMWNAMQFHHFDIRDGDPQYCTYERLARRAGLLYKCSPA